MAEQPGTTFTRWTPTRLGIGGALLCFVTLVCYVHFKFGLNIPPSTSGDEASYDSIGWQLSQGNGYRYDSLDKQFREPYDEAAKSDPSRFILDHHDSYIDTIRPPLYPYLMAGMNLLFGRQFWAIRLFDIAAMSAVCGLLVWCLSQRFGTSCAVVSIPLFVLLDVRTRLYSRAILTESITLLLVTLALLALLSFQKNRNWAHLIYAAQLTGLAWLARSAILLWLPFLALAVFVVAFEIRNQRRWKISFTSAAIFLLIAGLVYSPWVIRNYRVTDGEFPLGTQGAMELPAGYSDSAWEKKGVWVYSHYSYPLLGAHQSEIMDIKWATVRRNLAIEWIKENPFKAMALFPMKIGQELRPRSIPETILLGLAILGALFYPHKDERRVLLLFVCACLFGIGVTWSVEGRFIVPLLFIQHAFAAYALARILRLYKSPQSTEENESSRV